MNEVPSRSFGAGGTDDPAPLITDRSAEARLRRLARVMAELAGCRSSDEVTSVVIAHAADAVEASVASLSLLIDEDTLALVGLRGGSPNAGRWARYPLSGNLPTSQALRELRIVSIAGREQIEAAYPALAGSVGEGRAMVCLPLAVDERRLGVISLGFTADRSPDEQEIDFLSIFADTCAQALERLRALEEARDAAARLGLLADISTTLAESLDYRATLAGVARLTVPLVADWCSVEILEDGVLHTLAVAHTDPAKLEVADEYQRRYPSDPLASTGPPNVVRTGRSELYPEITDEMLTAAARDEEHLRMTRELGLRSVMIVPLTARGRVLGAMTLIAAESGRRFDEADLVFAENIARRAAMAIDNAQLFTETQEVAVRLQRAVLPTLRRRLGGLDVAFHYSPAGRTEVGGDFYDVVELPDGNVAAVVGDVAGRGVAAAAAMAQMRAALRAYLALDPAPAAVLDRLDAMFRVLGTSQLVTLVYLVIDVAEGRIDVANAGHPPPVLVSPDGACTPLLGPAGTPLGMGGTRNEGSASFPPGATLLAYTDGLVERRGADIDEGIDAVCREAASLGHGDLSVRLDELVRSRGNAGDDDITALALRRDR